MLTYHQKKPKPTYTRLEETSIQAQPEPRTRQANHTSNEIIKLKKGRFTISMSSSVLSQEKLKKIAEQILNWPAKH